ncbi:response regulator [Palleronia sp. LCG004]|uniref:response regulator n=1 Tax=Palleronia sp. LCG004 TaxID=3079304 RepID=UPI0029439750|nr:response regulator [Palleronia sp. LCG004]WOI57922.1 response regulator [Palleronia sp. LCG004]
MLRDLSSKDLSPVNILMVEDDDFEAKSVTRAFRKARLQNTIVRARNGVEALEILEGRHADLSLDWPLIVLIDINMPQMNGHQLIAEIRSRPALKRLVCFMLTTSTAVADIEQAYDYNVAGYIVKETAGADFTRLLNLLGDYWLTVQLPRSGG